MMDRLLCAAAVLTLLAALAGCNDNPVGRKCFVGGDGGPNQSIVASPALECPSRTCLHTPRERELPEGSEYADLCTARCSSDDDCDKVPESPCVTGFTCAVATTGSAGSSCSPRGCTGGIPCSAGSAASCRRPRRRAATPRCCAPARRRAATLRRPRSSRRLSPAPSNCPGEEQPLPSEHLRPVARVSVPLRQEPESMRAPEPAPAQAR